jgi:hypothetical protein
MPEELSVYRRGEKERFRTEGPCESSLPVGEARFAEPAGSSFWPFQTGLYRSRQKHPTPPTPNPRTEISRMAPRGPGFPPVAEEPLLCSAAPLPLQQSRETPASAPLKDPLQSFKTSGPRLRAPRFAAATHAQRDRSLATLIFDCANGSACQPHEVSRVAHCRFLRRDDVGISCQHSQEPSGWSIGWSKYTLPQGLEGAYHGAHEFRIHHHRFGRK